MLLMKTPDTSPDNFAVGLAFIGTALVHLLIVALLFSNWHFGTRSPKSFELPEPIRAELVSIEAITPPSAPAPAVPQSLPKPPPKTAAKPTQEPKPAVIEKPEPKAEPGVATPSATSTTAESSADTPAPATEPSPQGEQVLSDEDLFSNLLSGLEEEEAAFDQARQQAQQRQQRDQEIQQQVVSYSGAIREQISQRWSRPAELRLMDISRLQATVTVELLPTGELLAVALSNSSGSSSYDQSVLRAIERVRRFTVPEDVEVFQAGGFRRFTVTFKPEDLMNL